MKNKIHQSDCIEFMANLGDDSVDLTLTDIPYNAVNRSDNGIRNLDKGEADILTFDIKEFCESVYRITKNNIIIFCAKEQFSGIYSFFTKQKGTTRGIVWEKTNPSPMNGEFIYLSGIELAVWFKKAGSRGFNAFCKNTIFRHPLGSSKYHPTEKNHSLLKELILDNSNFGDLIFDPCCGSGSTLICAKELGRDYLGCDISEKYAKLSERRVNKAIRALI